MTFLPAIHLFKYANTNGFVPLQVGLARFGLVRPEVAAALAEYPKVWVKKDDALYLNDALMDVEVRTRAVDEVMRNLSKRGIIPMEPDYSAFGGTEWFPVGNQRKVNPLFQVRRFYSRFLGVQFDSIIVNGYHADGYWAATRSEHVDHARGLHDSMIVGCIRAENSMEDEIIEEGAVECGLPEEHAKHIVPVTQMQFFWNDRHGNLVNEMFYIFDFDTGKAGFTPRVVDEHEVARFDSIPFQDLLQLIDEGKRVKPEIMVTMLDFMVRHGHLNPDHPEYAHIKTLLAKTHDFYKTA